MEEPTVIVYPAIDLRQGWCVRLRQGRADQETVYDDDPAAVARRWVQQGAEWLHVVNLDGALGEGQAAPGLPVNLRRLAEVRAAVPTTLIQFGGGVRSLESVEAALALGASRVALGTAAVQRPELVGEAVRHFGPERIAVAIDARDGQVAIQGWQQTSEMEAAALGRAMRELGVVYAIYTDIARDGMLAGVNVAATAALARATGLKVIASGGVSSLVDLVQLKAYAKAGIEGVIIGQALYTGAISLAEAIQAAAGD
jgi:phosphoribosylformimino-5-aminoimidazole carboxamide ribotide isomerase